MASVNPLSRELVFKIVYYGPGLCGKTTTLEHLHASTKAEHRGKLVSLATPVDRTLYFDFLPLRLPTVRGMSIRLQLFTVPGQVYFNATRKLVLTGADGVVFVSDSQAQRADANLESLENLRDNLREQRRELSALPIVFQHNKRDLPDLLPLDEIDRMLNPLGAPSVATCAKTGEGVYEALSKISEAVLRAFEAKLPAELFEVDDVAGDGFPEEGLESALRDVAASRREAEPDDRVVARLEPPSRETEGAEMDAVSEAWEAASRSIVDEADVEALADDDETVALPTGAARPAVRAPGTDDLSASRPAAPDVEPRPTVHGPAFSFAELWPESEQALARELETAIAAGRATLAIELSDTLISRAFASAASLLGATDAPRDAAVVPTLLGIDGRRYLSFRSLVRAARAGAVVTARDALAAYAFAIEARLARSAIV